MNKLHNEKGVMLILAYIVIVVLLILGAVFLATIFNEKNLAERARQAQAAFYAAQKGLEYAYYETKTHVAPAGWGSGFITHYINLHGDPPTKYFGDLPDNALIPAAEITNPPQPPLLNSELSLNASRNCIIEEGTGCYTCNGGNFSVKAYQNPENREEIIILSRGRSGSTERILAQKISARSLYEFFVFTPSTLELSSGIWDCGTPDVAGAIHANGPIVFDNNVKIYNAQEFSTADYIGYNYYRFVRPEQEDQEYYWWLRTPWYIPLHQGEQDYYFNNPDGYVFGDTTNSPKDRDTWEEMTWEEQWALRDEDIWALFHWNDASHPDAWVPNRFAGTQWQTEKFYPDACSPTELCLEQPPPDEAPVWITRSDMQISQWASWVQQQGLGDVIYEENSGGETIIPLQITGGDYLDAAQTEGIYVEYDVSDDTYDLYINNQQFLDNSGSFLNDNDEILAEKKDFVNSNSTKTNFVVVLHIDKMLDNKTCGDKPCAPGNGLIYFKTNETSRTPVATESYGIVLTDAITLPTGGLTTASEGNIYLKGNFNHQPGIPLEDQNWQPASCISARYIYTLSNGFPLDNPPHSLPQTIHHPNYPYYSRYSMQGQNYIFETNSDIATIDGTTNTFNWYGYANSSMPNKAVTPANEPQIYNTATIGYYAYQPEILERWSYYAIPGAPYNATPNYNSWTSKARIITGAQVQLPRTNFIPSNCQSCLDAPDPSGCLTTCLNLDEVIRRSVWGSAPQFRRTRPGWPGDMSHVDPYGGNNKFFYETRWWSGENPLLPPFGLPGFIQGAWLEVYNFDVAVTELH